MLYLDFSVEVCELAGFYIEDLVAARERRSDGAIQGVDEVIHIKIVKFTHGERERILIHNGIRGQGVGCGNDSAACRYKLVDKCASLGHYACIFGQDHRGVGHIADAKALALNASLCLHHDLVAEVVGDMLILKFFHIVEAKTVDSLDLLCRVVIFTAVVELPRRRFWVDEECIRLYLTLCEKHSDSRHRIEEYGCVIPPGLLEEDRGWIIALSLALIGITLEVCAEEVDAAHHLMLEDSAQLLH